MEAQAPAILLEVFTLQQMTGTLAESERVVESELRERVKEERRE